MTRVQFLQMKNLLSQVKERIKATPTQYNQTTYCGTNCCIAGHIDVILCGPKEHAKKDSYHVRRFASQALGLDRNDVPDLFSPEWMGNIKAGTTRHMRRALKEIDKYIIQREAEVTP